MSNLNTGQFPDHVPDNLALPEAKPHKFVVVRGEDGGLLPDRQVHTVPAYAPSQADFDDMGPPSHKEGPVPPLMSKDLFVLSEEHPRNSKKWSPSGVGKVSGEDTRKGYNNALPPLNRENPMVQRGFVVNERGEFPGGTGEVTLQ